MIMTMPNDVRPNFQSDLLDIDEILKCINIAIRQASTEEDVRIRVSNCIEEKILKPLDIKQIGKYEYLLISGGRIDALYGHVIIEYKTVGKLSNESDIQKAKEQVIKYIKDKSGESEWSRYLGVIISDKVAFVRYDIRNDQWILRGPYNIGREVIIKLIEAFKGLSRKSLNVDNLVADFGPASAITRRAINLLYSKLINENSPRTKLLFEDWMRLFKQATGYDPEKLEELQRLVSEYDLSSNNVNYDAILFAIHTYYSLIMKLIAAEVAYLYGSGRFYRSYIVELDDAYNRGLYREIIGVLNELESGGIFRRLLGIENFLEGDYFSWYLNEFDQPLFDVIAEVARTLSSYEIATPQLEPEFARDLLKRLYQNLIPNDVRHGLGEFYTPDWLAELLLNDVGLSIDDLIKMGEEDSFKPLQIRVLDPACGSGTFLILYISRLRRYAEEHFLNDSVLRYLLNNVVGYDLNPLAVLTARTNYLLSIADLLGYSRGTGTIELPIYLADSIMVERKAELELGGQVYVLKTVAGEFKVPKNVAEKISLLKNLLDEIAMGIDNRYSPIDLTQRIERYKLDSNDKDILVNLYNVLLKLDEEGKDKVWISVLRNAFAPMLNGKFDFIIGNPPWIAWENLPEQYRESSKNLWENYKLAKFRGGTGMGKAKKDLSMLFLVRSFNLYLKEGGKLGFLMTFTIFKTQAGAGFRNYLINNTKIHIIHDLVTLRPFEGAINRTGAIVVEKTQRKDNINAQRANMSGVKHIIWDGKQIPPDTTLEEVLKTTRRYDAVMIPLILDDPSSPWMQTSQHIIHAIRKIINGEQYYEAYEGVNPGINQIYYVKILRKNPDNYLIITNPSESGQKKKVKQIEVKVEPDLVYPLIRGRDIKKWFVDFKDRYIIMPVDSQGRDINLNNMRIKYPNTYNYFYTFFNDLINRGGEPYKSKLKPYRKIPFQEAERVAPPFYWIFNAKHSLAPYKVVWQRIAGAITGKAVSFACAVIDPIKGIPLIPDDGTILIEAGTRDEAYYIAGFLNSLIVRTIIASYTYELRQETHIADIIKIPKFDPNNQLHVNLSNLSQKAHKLTMCIFVNDKPDYCLNINAEEELNSIENKIDFIVAKLLELSENDLEMFRRMMSILSGNSDNVTNSM